MNEAIKPEFKNMAIYKNYECANCNLYVNMIFSEELETDDHFASVIFRWVKLNDQQH